MKIVLADCDRCGKQKECIQVVVTEMTQIKDYEFHNVCESCIGNMLYHEECF